MSTRRFAGNCRAVLGLAIVVVLLLGPPRATRSSTALHWFGNDGRTAAMGGGGAALGSGPAALLSNPALLSLGPNGAWLSFSVAPSFLHIDPDARPAGYDVPESVYDADATVGWSDRPVPTSRLTNDRRTTDDLDPAYVLNIAGVSSLGADWIKIGIGVTLPLPEVISFTGWYNDEREQHFTNRLHFERFGEFDQLLAIYPAISFAPLEWLAWGIALKVDLGLGLDAGMYLPQGEEWEYAYLSPKGEVKPALRPIAGMAFLTPFGLRLGLVYRHVSYLDVNIDVRIRIWNVESNSAGEEQNQFLQHYRFVAGYEPSEVVLAAGYAHERFSLEADVTFERWSEYLDRHGNQWTHPGADPAAAGGAGWEDPVFEDVWSVRGGGEVWLTDFAALRAGAGYFPSPMPDQTGRYNYVDNDIILYSLGTGFRFPVAGRPVTVDLAAQLWQMRSLTVHKTLPNKLSARNGGLIDEVPDSLEDSATGEPLAGSDGLQTNNPGFPGYGLGGVELHVMLMLGVELD